MIFDNQMISNQEKCLMDNRAVTLTFYDPGTKKSKALRFVFSSIFRIQVFLSLLNIKWSAALSPNVG